MSSDYSPEVVLLLDKLTSSERLRLTSEHMSERVLEIPFGQASGGLSLIAPAEQEPDDSIPAVLNLRVRIRTKWSVVKAEYDYEATVRDAQTGQEWETGLSNLTIHVTRDIDGAVYDYSRQYAWICSKVDTVHTFPILSPGRTCMYATATSIYHGTWSSKEICVG